MKKNDIPKLLALLAAILFFAALLISSIASSLIGFLEENGVETTLEVRIAATAFVILLVSIVTYKLLPKPKLDNSKPKRANRKYK